ncbi:30S ribosomal protein S2 [Candidatus Hepatincolaceae symbiont of Richtersius coronifer]
MANFTIKQLLENGVHYGHSTRRWNPKMSKYIYGTYNNIHVIDLQKTAPLFANALENIQKVIASGGRILFVGTKKQATPIIKEYAEKCGQYYVNHRWLGGMLTNWKTISLSINNLDKLDKKITEGLQGLTKKERLQIAKEREKLNLVLGGIRKMGGLPDMIFILDCVKESIAIEEASKLGIPVVAIVDTNADPDRINFPIPGNDDAVKAIKLYCEVISMAVLDGLRDEAKTKMKDIGEDPNLEIKLEAKQSTNSSPEIYAQTK